MQSKILNEKSMKKRSRLPTSIFSRFLDQIWDGKSTKIRCSDQKSIQNPSKIDPKRDLEGFWAPKCVFGVARSISTTHFDHFWAQFRPKIGPKLVINRPKNCNIPIPTSTLNSMTFFDRFLIKF